MKSNIVGLLVSLILFCGGVFLLWPGCGHAADIKNTGLAGADRKWVRDYGPFSIYEAAGDGYLSIVDANYYANQFPPSNGFPSAPAEELGVTSYRLSIVPKMGNRKRSLRLCSGQALMPLNGLRPWVRMSQTRLSRWFVTTATTVTLPGEKGQSEPG